MPKSEVFNQDCLEGMKQFPDKHFELAIVDPPYGIGIVAPGKRHYGIRKSVTPRTIYKSAGWDNIRPSKEYFFELARVSHHRIIWGANYFVEQLPPSPGWIIWDKNQPLEVSFAMAELAYTSFDRSAKVFYQTRGSEKKIHPTQKPVALYKWLLKNYAKPGDKILDTHLGSGSSRIAAYEMGFDFTGYELDKDYFDASCKRFEQYRSQLKMFTTN